MPPPPPPPPPSLSDGPASRDNALASIHKPPASHGDSSTRQPSIRRDNPENFTKVLAEAVKCAQALKTDDLITDTRVKEAFAELMNKVYPHLPESLQDQLIADFRLNILRRAQEKNTPPVELMDGERKKNFLGRKGTRTNTLWIIEKLVLLVGISCFMYLMSLYVTEN
ncbi:hypothetical protein ACQJBY_012777 [Aegilops geniculata]